MFSRGMLFALASAMIVRRRGLVPGSPPPLRAATVNSLMMRVKALPRLASAAPFLCLIVCHLEWPDMAETPTKTRKTGPGILPRGPLSFGPLTLLSFRKYHPDVGARIPGTPSVIAEQSRDFE